MSMESGTEIKKVALYARVATEDGSQDTEKQLIALCDYCKKQGWIVVREYVDRETGGASKRRHFQQMLNDATARIFNMVLFWSLDRFSCEGVSDTLAHLERLTAADVNWRSLTERYIDSCGIFRHAVAGILAVIAKQEHVRRSERAAAAIAKLRQQGETDHLGRRRLVFDRSTAHKLHQQGVSIRKIAAMLGVSAMTIQRAIKSAAA